MLRAARLRLALLASGSCLDVQRKEHRAHHGKAAPTELAESSEGAHHDLASSTQEKRLVAQDHAPHAGHRSADKAARAAAKPAAAAAPPAPAEGGLGDYVHAILVVLQFGLVVLVVRHGEYGHAASVLALTFVVEAAASFLLGDPSVSVTLMIAVSVLFTINPVEDAERPFKLHMGTVPMLCVLWLGGVGLLSSTDLVRALYGSDSLRPYHLVVMFLGSVYLCTALERSGFLHTAAVKVVTTYGRSPWGLFWALGCFSGVLTVLIPDDIVTMTLTPITIRMCQLLNLPEIPFLFSQAQGYVLCMLPCL